MKSSVLNFLFAATVGLVLFQSNSGGRAATAGQGNCGAPGDAATTCINCHNSGSINASIAVGVFDDNDSPVDELTPGTTYRVRVELSGAGANGYGFQMLALDQPGNVNGEDIATWSNPSANVQIAEANNGRTYVEQAGTSVQPLFEVDWMLPMNPTDNTTFYVCGNAVNGNGQNTGDGAACTTLTLPTAVTSSVRDLGAAVRTDLLPNPVSGAVAQLRIADAPAGTYDLRLLGTDGRSYVEQTVQFSGNTETVELPVADLTPGVYFVQIQHEGRQRTVRLVRK